MLPRWNPRRISRIEGNFRLNWGDPLFLHVKKQHNLHISPPSPHIAEALQSTKLKLRKYGILCWTFEKAKNPTTARTREIHQTWVSHIYPTKALWPYSFSLRLWQCHVLPIAWLCLSSPCSSRRRAWAAGQKSGKLHGHSDVTVTSRSVSPCPSSHVEAEKLWEINVSTMSQQCLHCLHLSNFKHFGTFWGFAASTLPTLPSAARSSWHLAASSPGEPCDMQHIQPLRICTRISIITYCISTLIAPIQDIPSQKIAQFLSISCFQLFQLSTPPLPWRHWVQRRENRALHSLKKQHIAILQHSQGNSEAAVKLSPLLSKGFTYKSYNIKIIDRKSIAQTFSTPLPPRSISLLGLCKTNGWSWFLLTFKFLQASRWGLSQEFHWFFNWSCRILHELPPESLHSMDFATSCHFSSASATNLGFAWFCTMLESANISNS